MKILNFLLFRISIFLFSRNWLQILNNDIKNKKSFKRINSHKFNNDNSLDYLEFRTRKKLNIGWYLFGIKHYGENIRTFGILKVGEYGFSQSRPMFPVKRRWRVIRVNNKNHLTFKLLNINKKLEMKEFWLIKIPFKNAIQRIKKRIYIFNPNYIKKSKSFSDYWRIYNKTLNNLINNNFISYKTWIKEIEIPLINGIKNQKNKFEKNKISFKDQDYCNAEIIENNIWVYPKSDMGYRHKYAEFFYKDVIKKFPEANLIYCDDDYLNDDGTRLNPNFKSAWNRELFISDENLINSFIVSSELWNWAIFQIKKNDTEINKFNLILEVTNKLEKENKLNSIIHIPLILFHIRKNENNVQNFNNNNNPNIDYLYKFLNREKKYFGVIKKINFDKEYGIKRLTWTYPKETKLSIIIPTKDKYNLISNCLNSIIKYDPQCAVEILIVDNNSKDKKSIEFIHKFRKINSQIDVKILDYKYDFNYAKINNYAANYVTGDAILFLNNDTEFTHKGWGKELMSNVLRPGVGFVGVKLIYNDHTIQHAGVILGIGGVAGHSHKFISSKDPGYFKRIQSCQEYSALTAACLAIKIENWKKLNGFDDKRFKVNYNDVDICLRARELKLRNIYLPNVVVFHHESKTRGRPEYAELKRWHNEKRHLLSRWDKLIKDDPYYNPNLSLINEDFSIGISDKKRIKPRTICD